MNKKFLLMTVLCASLCNNSYGAESAKITLDIGQVLELVNANNKDVAASRRQVDAAAQGVKVAEADRLPDFSASLSVSYLGDATIMDRDFSNAFRAPMPHLSNGLDVNLYQPVYAGGAITAGIDMAKSQRAMSEVQLRQTRQDVGIQAVSCFLELFKSTNLRSVYNENIAITKRVISEMTSRHQEGVVLKNDITRYELRLSTLNYDLIAINNRIEVLNHDLCVLLGLDEGTEVVTDIDRDLAALPSASTYTDWYGTTLDNSSALRMLDLKSELNRNEHRILKADYLPHIGIIAGDSFTGPITVEVPTLNNNLNYWYVGVNVKYNISSLFKTPKAVKKNEAERITINLSREATEDHLNRKIKDAFVQYTQAIDMLKIEEKNVELAEENYRVVENRYNNQLALLTDMLDASTAKLDADVRLVNARVNIIYYYYQLKYNSGTL